MSWGAWTGFLRRRRWLLAPLLVGLVAVAARIAAGMPIEHDPFAIFASDRPEVAYVEEFWEVYGQDTNFFLVLAEPRNGDLYAPRVLAELRRLTRGLAGLPRAVTADSVATARRLLVTAGELKTQPLLPPGPVGTEAAATAAARAASTPTIAEAFTNEAGTVTAVMVRFDDGMTAYEDWQPALAELPDLLASVPDDLLKLTPVGLPMVEEGYVELIRGDQRRFMPWVLGMLLVVLLFLFRSGSGTLLPLFSVGSSAAVAVAIMRLSGESFNIITFTIPTLILVIGIADCIHLLERFLEERRAGHPVPTAVDRSTRAIGSAVVLTSATTAVGFASLIMAEIFTIQEFGLWAAAGIVVAFFVTITIVPVWLSIWPVPVKGYETHDAPDAIDRALGAVARLSVRHPGRVLAFWAVVLAVCLVGASQVERDSSLLEELFPDHPLVQAQTYAETNGFAVLPVEVDLVGPPGAFKDPAVLAKVAEVQGWLGGHPYISRSTSYLDLVRELHRAFEGEPGIFDSRAALGQALFLFESMGTGELDRWVTPDYARMHVRGMRYDTGLTGYEQLFAELKAKLAATFPAGDVTAAGPAGGEPAGEGMAGAVQYHITGSSRIATEAVDAIVTDLFRSLGLALVIIAVLMTVLFRSLRIGLISMLPNLLPLVIAAAVMGFAGYSLRISSGIIYTVALGIAVDDTIHFLARYRAERRRGAGAEAAIETTVRTAGRAILWTSVLLVLGFAVLMQSSFRGIYEFGLLVGIALAVAVVADLSLLPAMLLKARPFWGQAGEAAEAAPEPPGDGGRNG